MKPPAPEPVKPKKKRDPSLLTKDYFDGMSDMFKLTINDLVKTTVKHVIVKAFAEKALNLNATAAQKPAPTSDEALKPIRSFVKDLVRK